MPSIYTVQDDNILTISDNAFLLKILLSKCNYYASHIGFQTNRDEREGEKEDGRMRKSEWEKERWYEKVKERDRERVCQWKRERKMMVWESQNERKKDDGKRKLQRERERERWRLQRTQNRLFFILIRGAKTQKCIFLKQIRWKLFFKKWANPGLFFVYFWSFQTNITIFTTNVHPLYGAGIRTHNLWNVSLFP